MGPSVFPFRCSDMDGIEPDRLDKSMGSETDTVHSTICPGQGDIFG